MIDKIAFFKNYHEMQQLRREKIYEQFFYFLSLLAIEIGFFGFYLLNFPTLENKNTLVNTIFYMLLIITALLILKVFFIVKQWVSNMEYEELPKPNDIKEYLKQLNALEVVDQNRQWNDFLLDSYIHISDFNVNINNKRHAINMKFRKYLGYTLFALFISFIPYFILMGNELNSQKIIILNKSIEFKEKEVKIKIVNDKLVIDGTITNIKLYNKFIDTYIETKVLEIINNKKDDAMSNDKENKQVKIVQEDIPKPPLQRIQDSVEIINDNKYKEQSKLNEKK